MRSAGSKTEEGIDACSREWIFCIIRLQGQHGCTLLAAVILNVLPRPSKVSASGKRTVASRRLKKASKLAKITLELAQPGQFEGFIELSFCRRRSLLAICKEMTAVTHSLSAQMLPHDIVLYSP